MGMRDVISGANAGPWPELCLWDICWMLEWQGNFRFSQGKSWVNSADPFLRQNCRVGRSQRSAQAWHRQQKIICTPEMQWVQHKFKIHQKKKTFQCRHVRRPGIPLLSYCLKQKSPLTLQDEQLVDKLHSKTPCHFGCEILWCSLTYCYFILPLQVFVLKKGRSTPIITAVIAMPVSEAVVVV